MLHGRQHRRGINPVGPTVEKNCVLAECHGKLGQGNFRELSQGPKIEIFEERQHLRQDRLNSRSRVTGKGAKNIRSEPARTSQSCGGCTTSAATRDTNLLLPMPMTPGNPYR